MSVARGGILWWEVDVEDAAVRHSEMGHIQSRKMYRQPSDARDCGCVDPGFEPRRRTLQRGFGLN